MPLTRRLATPLFLLLAQLPSKTLPLKDSHPPTLFTPKGVRDGWAAWIARWQPPRLGCLRARVDRPEDSKDPCLTAPDAKYRGQENQLYRVEIHQGGSAGKATFKWSRDNGAVVSRVELSGVELVAEKPLGFSAGIWVELSNDGQELRGYPGKLVKLLKVEGDRLTLESPVSRPADIPPEEAWPTKARRWEQSGKGGVTLKEGAITLKESITETDWLDLENGIQIQFLPSSDETIKHIYRTGDYWLIPARVATGNIEWPLALDEEGHPQLDRNRREIPLPRPPFGSQHHYAPLAIVVADKPPVNCRCQLPPLNDCKMPSFGEEGVGGRPLCDAPDTATPE